jgi:hypothetical protein
MWYIVSTIKCVNFVLGFILTPKTRFTLSTAITFLLVECGAHGVNFVPAYFYIPYRFKLFGCI